MNSLASKNRLKRFLTWISSISPNDWQRQREKKSTPNLNPCSNLLIPTTTRTKFIFAQTKQSKQMLRRRKGIVARKKATRDRGKNAPKPPRSSTYQQVRCVPFMLTNPFEQLSDSRKGSLLIL